MIGERHAPDHFAADRFQGAEKLGRPADAGKGDNCAPA